MKYFKVPANLDGRAVIKKGLYCGKIQRFLIKNELYTAKELEKYGMAEQKWGLFRLIFRKAACTGFLARVLKWMRLNNHEETFNCPRACIPALAAGRRVA